MKISEFTTEELADRWADHREVENLMARWTYYGILRDIDAIEGLWCREAEPCLGCNDGYYKGREAVSGYYAALKNQLRVQAETAKAVYAEALGDKSVEELLGVGSFVANNLTAPLIELAGDGKTAKGLWYLYGTDVDLKAQGPSSEWVFGRVGADFIKEGDTWRLWHLLVVEDVRAPYRHKWTEALPAAEAIPAFSPIAAAALPAPNVPCTVMEHYHNRRPNFVIPPLPVRYDRFADTFSYGI